MRISARLSLSIAVNDDEPNPVPDRGVERGVPKNFKGLLDSDICRRLLCLRCLTSSVGALDHFLDGILSATRSTREARGRDSLSSHVICSSSFAEDRLRTCAVFLKLADAALWRRSRNDCWSDMGRPSPPPPPQPPMKYRD
eukprot:Sspe_Gene.27566::Locus_11951_Transcript_1_1_Confidence_1.000_Length_1820::g.27566::m.27566